MADKRMAEKFQRQQQQLQFTPEEEEIMKRVRKDGLFKFQLPCSFGAAGITYQLMKTGKMTPGGPVGAPPMQAYFPKCCVSFLGAFIVTGVMTVRRLGAELLKVDGAYSRHVKEIQERKIGGNFRAPPPVSDVERTPVSSSTEQQNYLDSIVKPDTEDLTPARSLTYDDLRRKNRLYTDTPGKQPPQQFPQQPPQRPTQQPIQPTQPPPPTLSPKPQSTGPTNKYGDEWSET